MDEWVRLLPTYDRVDLFRQHLEAFAGSLPAAQYLLFTALIARAVANRSPMRHASQTSDLQSLLAELSPVTFASASCP